MKIRLRTYLNNIVVGLLPLILVSIIFLITYSKKSRQYIQDNMEVSISNLKMFLEDDLEKYRNHAFFLARENYQHSRTQAINHFDLNNDSIFGIRQKLRVTEIFIETNNVFRDMHRWRDFKYNIDKPEAAYLWKSLNQPQYTRRYNTSIPFIKDGVLIFRNCAIIYQKNKNKKLGFITLSLPLDISYFQDLEFQDPGAIYFIQTSKGLVFSDPSFQTPQIQQQVLEGLKQKDKLSILKFKNKGKYFLHRSTFIPVPRNINNRMIRSWTYLGVLFNEEKLNKQFLSFQKIYRLSMLLSVFLILLVAIWFSNSLTRPLKALQTQVKNFERDYQKVDPPSQNRDEISQLQSSISRMSEHILVNKKIIEEERNNLRLKQEAQITELELARKIQSRLLPLNSPWPKLNFFFRSMEEVSGDFFDFLALSKQETGIFIADVSGHGVPAALITTMLKSYILQSTPLAHEPAKFLEQCNQFLLDNIGSNFVTALYGVYNKKLKIFTYCNAGHLGPLIICPDRIYNPEDEIKAPCLGIFHSNELEERKLLFKDNTLQLNKGEVLLLYTDGMTEAIPSRDEKQQHGQGKEFGEQQLMLSLRDYLSSDTKALIPFLVEQLRDYRNSYDFEDDVCIISLDIE